MYRTLIVDDNYWFAQHFLHCQAFCELGIDIIDVESNPAIGLKKFFLLKPDIIVLGESSYFISPTDFFDRLKQVYTQRDFSIICLTDHPDAASWRAQYGISALMSRDAYTENMMCRAFQSAIAALQNDAMLLNSYDPSVLDYADRKNDILNRLTSQQDFHWQLIKAANLSIGKYPVFLLVGHPDRMHTYPPEILSALFDQIKHILSEYKNGEIFVTRSCSICIIINDFLQDTQKYSLAITSFHQLIDHLAEQVSAVLKTGFHFFLSDRIDTIAQLSAWTKKLQDFSKFSYFAYDRKVLYFQNPHQIVKQPNYRAIDHIAANLTLAAAQNDLVSTSRLIDELYLIQVKPTFNFLGLYIVREKLNNLFEIITLLCNIPNVSFYDWTYQPVSIDAELHYVKDCIETLCNTLSSQKKLLNQTVLHALTYAVNHFSESISEASVAEAVGISTAYLSRLLNKSSSSNFSQLLNKIRVNKAKELLIASNYKISEIAIKVGFNNAKYFNKVFKIYTGTTPTQYIESVKEKDKICDTLDMIKV